MFQVFKWKLGMVVTPATPTPLEIEAGGLRVWELSVLHHKTLFQKTKQEYLNEYTRLYLFRCVAHYRSSWASISCVQFTLYLCFSPHLLLHSFLVVMHQLFENYLESFPKSVYYCVSTLETHNGKSWELHYYVKVFLSWDRINWNSLHNFRLLWNMSFNLLVLYFSFTPQSY
jgi:hypothetical protein